MFIRYKKHILILILTSIAVSNFYFLAIKPVQATDGGGAWAQQIQYFLKEFILDSLARFLSGRLLKKYLDSMVSQINKSSRTGRDPAFVSNWRKFLTDAQSRGEQVFRNILGNTVLCPHNGNIRTIFNAPAAATPTNNQGTRVNNLDPFTRRARCTMPAGWTLQAFERSFDRNGGWEALDRLANPQNNFFGSLLMSMGEVAAQRAIDEASDTNESRAGAGFTGTRSRCSGASASGSGVCAPGLNQCVGGRYAGRSCVDSLECASPNFQPTCTFLGETLTPPKILSDTAAQAWDKRVGMLLTADELSEIVFNLFGSLLDKLINFRGRAATNPDGSDADDPSAKDRDSAFQDCLAREQCNGKPADAYRACTQLCAQESGAITPGDYNFQNPPGGPPRTCPGGTTCSGQSVTGTIGQIVCGLGGTEFQCTTTGWITNGNTCTCGSSACNNNGACDSGESYPACPNDCLPDGSTANTFCDDGSSSPNATNNCITAQWAKQGGPIAQLIDPGGPTGVCSQSHCVVLNYSNNGAITSGTVVQNTRLISTITNPQGVTVDICHANGTLTYTMDLGNGLTVVNTSVDVPPLGAGTCGTGGGPVCGQYGCEPGEDPFSCPSDCGIPLP